MTTEYEKVDREDFYSTLARTALRGLCDVLDLLDLSVEQDMAPECQANQETS